MHGVIPNFLVINEGNICFFLVLSSLYIKVAIPIPTFVELLSYYLVFIIGR